MVNLIKRWYSNIKIWQKLLLLFLIVALLPIFVMSSVTYSFANKEFKNQMISSVNSSMNKVVNIIDDKAVRYQNIINNIAYDTELISILSQEPKSNEQRLYSYTRGATISSIASIPELTSFEIKYKDTSSDFLSKYNPQKEIYKILWFIDNDKIYVYKNVIDIYTNKPLGYILATLDGNKFFGEYFKKSFENYGLYINDNTGNGNFSIWNMESSTIMPAYDTINTSKNNILSFMNTKYLTSEYKFNQNNWSVVFLVPYSTITSKINPLIAMTLIVTFFCLLFAIFISVFNSLYLSKRINNILGEIKRVASGDITSNITSVSGDELGQLSFGFHNMVQKINTLINDVYVSKLNEKESQFRALQAQINPHFLYNCLDKINWRAIISGNDEISKIVLHLADFYRTALNKGKIFTTLKNEMLNIRSYVDLQLEIHANSFTAEYEIDENLLDYTIINLALQPIVENALVHGIDKNEKRCGKLKLSLSSTNGDIKIAVFNSGTPISKDFSLGSGKNTGYGMSNVNDRLLMTYGEGYGIHIYPVENGTECTILIPKRLTNEEV